jgi:hypothetical protein
MSDVSPSTGSGKFTSGLEGAPMTFGPGVPLIGPCQKFQIQNLMSGLLRVCVTRPIQLLVGDN